MLNLKGSLKMKNKKKIYYSIAIILSIFLISIPFIFTFIHLGYFHIKPHINTFPKVNDPNAEILNFVADNDFYPYSKCDDSYQISGMNIELAHEIANRLNMKIHIDFGNWNYCKEKIKSKQTDILLGYDMFTDKTLIDDLKTIPITKELIKLYGKNKINSLGELKNKKIGICINSFFTNAFDFNCEYIEYKSTSEVLEALIKDEIDFAICHASVAENKIKSKNYQIRQSFPIIQSFFGLGVLNNNKDLNDKLENVIEEMINDKTIEKLEKKWIENTSNHGTLKDIFKNHFMFYTLYGIFIFILIATSLIYIKIIKIKEESLNIILRKQVLLSSCIQDAFLLTSCIIPDTDECFLLKIKQNNFSEEKLLNGCNGFLDILNQIVCLEDLEKITKVFNNISLMKPDTNEKYFYKTPAGSSHEIIFNCTKIKNQKIIIILIKDITELIEMHKNQNTLIQEKENFKLLSKLDPFTNLLNKSAMEEECNYFLTNNNAQNAAFIIIDLDNFKQINDNFGHKTGDIVLKSVSKKIQSIFRNSDYISRFGGDEFSIFIPKINSNCLESKLKILSEKLTETFSKDDKKYNVTASIGCAYNMGKITTYKKLFTFADEALYKAKNKGKNCFIISKIK